MSGDSLWDDDGEEEIIEVDGEVVKDEDEEQENLPTADDSNSVVKPVDDLDQVVEAYDKYEEVKERLLSTSDVTQISGNNFINKSGWRKIATAFNLSIETLDTERTVEDGVVRYQVKARAVAPNGKAVTGYGLCGSNESNFMETGTPDGTTTPEDHDEYLHVDGRWRRLKQPRAVDEHVVQATAETRAKNRAISDLVGGGEVSSEEMASKKKQDILED